MKKGDKVKCVDNLGNDYLTTGKVYDVIAGEGDLCSSFGNILREYSINIRDDDGDRIFVYLNNDAHAIWEVVND